MPSCSRIKTDVILTRGLIINREMLMGKERSLQCTGWGASYHTSLTAGRISKTYIPYKDTE